MYLLTYIDSLIVRQSVQKALNRGEAYHRLKRAVFHENEGRFRVKTELEQHIWNDCARFLTNCIIFYNAYILSVLLTQAEKAERTEEAEIIKRISPIAWQHVNFLGRFVFQRQQNGPGRINVYIFGKRDLLMLHMAFKANRNRAEVARSSKESCCPIMAVRFV